MKQNNLWTTQMCAYVRWMLRNKWSEDLQVQPSAENRRRLKLINGAKVPKAPGCYRIMNTSKSMPLIRRLWWGLPLKEHFTTVYIGHAENLRERVFTHVAGRSTSYIAEYILKHCRTIRIQYVETGDKYTAQWLEIDLFEEFKRDARWYGNEYDLPSLNRQTPRTEPKQHASKKINTPAIITRQKKV